jgi:hypothetical protein
LADNVGFVANRKERVKLHRGSSLSADRWQLESGRVQ